MRCNSPAFLCVPFASAARGRRAWAKTYSDSPPISGKCIAEDDRFRLPEGWVDYQRTAHPGNENANYGAQLWLYPDDIEDRALPARRFAMVGYGGQSVMVAPEDDLVIVRMGWDVGIDPWNRSAFFDSVADALGLR